MEVSVNRLSQSTKQIADKIKPDFSVMQYLLKTRKFQKFFDTFTI